MCDEGVSECGSAQRAGGGRLSGAGAHKFGAPPARLAACLPARVRLLLESMLLMEVGGVPSQCHLHVASYHAQHNTSCEQGTDGSTAGLASSGRTLLERLAGARCRAQVTAKWRAPTYMHVRTAISILGGLPIASRVVSEAPGATEVRVHAGCEPHT